VLFRECDERTTLVTGAPPKNLGAAVERGGLVLGRWVAQGGFAGEGVVPEECQLPQFKGKITCPSYNLDGAPRATRAALAAPGIRARRFVSKNICHSVIYDASLHATMAAVKDQSLSLRLIWQGMEAYLGKHRAGKKLHDPLAACCAIDETIGIWAEVELFRDKAGWGARLAPGSGTFIITGYDRPRFVEVLTMH
jgi:pyrimidine-specific ribonucleoside hydrolase